MFRSNKYLADRCGNIWSGRQSTLARATPSFVVLVGLVAACALIGAAQPARAVEGKLRQLIQAHDLRDTRVGLVVQDLSNGRMVASINGDRKMIPASNMKLITTAAALQILGPDFRFHTHLKRLPPAAGKDKPRLLIEGDGDPAFGDPVLLERYGHSVDALLEQWVEAASKTSTTRFGGLLVDDRVFDRQFVHDDWPRGQLIRHYCAQVAGINFHENVLHVMPRPAKRAGQAPRIELYPHVPFMEQSNRAVTGRKGIFAIDRKLGTNHLRFTGAVRHKPSEPYKLTFHDPPMVFAKVLRRHLEQGGLATGPVSRPPQQAQLPSGRTLAVATTTLKLVLQRTNRQSENMFAEALFKRMGRALTGRPGSWQTGKSAVQHVARRMLGPASRSLRIADGSGMSRANQVTPRLVAKLLAKMHRLEKLGPIYRRSLAQGGRHGTLEDRLGELTGTVYGKSGYLNGVSALSGYLVVPQGRGSKTLAFSLLFNGFSPPLRNHDMKRLQNQMIQALDRAYARPAAVGG
jgi:D-alanyl-D-alanine carboxypeptidase/D-alanyl-D-alanine-endopeptidase (penicillin-binding protein 4)